MSRISSRVKKRKPVLTLKKEAGSSAGRLIFSDLNGNPNIALLKKAAGYSTVEVCDPAILRGRSNETGHGSAAGFIKLTLEWLRTY